MPKDSDDLVTTKPSKSAKGPRRFPWRLWLYAIAVTAGAGAGGWYTYQFRTESKAHAAEADQCKLDKNTLTARVSTLDITQKQLTDCAIKLGDEKKRADGLQVLNASQMTSKPADPGAAPHADAGTLAAIDDIQKSLAKSIEAKRLTVSMRRGEFVLTLPSDSLFAPGSVDVSDTGKVAVLEIGFTLRKYGDRRFQITAHASDVAAAKAPAPKDNWELSTERALSVTRALSQQAGVDAKNLVVAGAGDSDPLVGQAKSDRIEIALLPGPSEIAALPATLGADTAIGAATAAKPATPAPASPATPAAPAPAGK